MDYFNKFQHLFSGNKYEPVDFGDQLEKPITLAIRRAKSNVSWNVNADGNVYCHKCGITQPRTSFGSALSNGCKTCISVQNKSQKETYTATWWGAMKRLYDDAKRSAQKRKMEFYLTFEEMIFQLKSQGGLCYYSGVPMTSVIGDYKISIERLNVRLTYSHSNIVFICQEFNSIDNTRMKSDNDDSDGCGGWSKEKYQEVLLNYKTVNENMN